jgi:2-oxoglutarate dehydrogenase E1 component
MKDLQYITSQHPAFIEGLYQDYVKDPNSVDPDLKKFFEGFDFALSTVKPNKEGNGTVEVAAVLPAPGIDIHESRQCET